MSDDFDRRKVRCWHDQLLYECDSPEHSEPRAGASHRYNYTAETVTFYHGSGQFYVPITDRTSDMFGGQTIHDVPPCDHRHTSVEAAQACGDRLVAKAVREWNKAHGLT